jgi:hypothetical protein
MAWRPFSCLKPTSPSATGPSRKAGPERQNDLMPIPQIRWLEAFLWVAGACSALISAASMLPGRIWGFAVVWAVLAAACAIAAALLEYQARHERPILRHRDSPDVPDAPR